MYNVNAVCKLLNIKPHTLRYWEQEIPMLSQRKSQTGRKIYTKVELQLLLRIRHLIHNKKYTLEGVKEKLWQDINNINPDIKSRIISIKSSLLDILNLVREKDSNYKFDTDLQD